MTSRLTALETAYANARDLDFPAIRVIVAEAFAGLDKAQAIALARQFGIRKTLPSKAAAVADAERKIAERLGSWQRCQFRQPA